MSFFLINWRCILKKIASIFTAGQMNTVCWISIFLNFSKSNNQKVFIFNLIFADWSLAVLSQLFPPCTDMSESRQSVRIKPRMEGCLPNDLPLCKSSGFRNSFLNKTFVSKAQRDECLFLRLTVGADVCS